jgi:hypothetical protein
MDWLLKSPDRQYERPQIERELEFRKTLVNHAI